MGIRGRETGFQDNSKIPRLNTTVARLKLKGFGGSSRYWWSMWFNAMIRAEPYPVLNAQFIILLCSQALHGRRQFVP